MTGRGSAMRVDQRQQPLADLVTDAAEDGPPLPVGAFGLGGVEERDVELRQRPGEDGARLACRVAYRDHQFPVLPQVGVHVPRPGRRDVHTRLGHRPNRERVDALGWPGASGARLPAVTEVVVDPARGHLRAAGVACAEDEDAALRGQDAYGCLVYRAGRREGPFLRVSPRILRLPPGAVGDLRELSFVDTRVEKGKTYYYYLDLVRDSGVKERFSPVLSKTVE